MRAQPEHRLVNSSAENNLGALKDGRQDINQQPTQQQWQLAASWATEAQAEDWGKQLFCFMHDLLV